MALREETLCSCMHVKTTWHSMQLQSTVHARTHAHTIPRSQHQGGAPSLVLVLNIGDVLEQEVDDVPMPLPAGQRQGDVVLTARGHVDLCTVVQKKLGHREMPFPERKNMVKIEYKVTT